jgi:hypothetical protein
MRQLQCFGTRFLNAPDVFHNAVPEAEFTGYAADLHEETGTYGALLRRQQNRVMYPAIYVGIFAVYNVKYKKEPRILCAGTEQQSGK